MEAGIQIFYQGGVHPGMSDYEMIRHEVDLCITADRLGVDYLMNPEHHFTDYCVAPDPLQVLSYLAGVTRQIKLVTGAIILPWNDPARVAEKITLMDAVSDGRLIVGFGRGLARDEYARLNIPLSEARERFDESAEMIIEALRTGVMKGDGPFYPRQPTLIKPSPERSFEDRLIAIGRSEDSVLAAADIGAALTFVIQKPIEQYVPVVTKYRERFVEAHGRGAPPLWLINHLFVHEDAEEAERVAHEYMQSYLVTALEHYGYAGKHFTTTKGYENYAAGAEEIRRIGIEESARKAVELQVFGTPDQVLEKLRERQRVVGDHVALFCVSYAGMPFEMANRNLTLFGEAVLPKLHAFPSVRWN